jgi:hypothetical protein
MPIGAPFALCLLHNKRSEWSGMSVSEGKEQLSHRLTSLVESQAVQIAR